MTAGYGNLADLRAAK
jgi:hypothetical protein